jgi:hypothetical protein
MWWQAHLDDLSSLGSGWRWLLIRGTGLYMRTLGLFVFIFLLAVLRLAEVIKNSYPSLRPSPLLFSISLLFSFQNKSNPCNNTRWVTLCLGELCVNF